MKVLLLFLVALLGTAAPEAHFVATPKSTQTPLFTVSYYGKGFHGKTAANCTTFDKNELTVAVWPWLIKDKVLTFGSVLALTNPENGNTVELTVTDTGGFAKYDRALDLSEHAAEVLDFKQQGVADVAVRVVSRLERNKFGTKCQRKKKRTKT